MLNALISAPRVGAKAMIAILPQIIKKQAEIESRDIYITDALQVIAENTARFAGGSKMKSRYADIISTSDSTRKKKPKDNRSGEQIAADIIGKIARKEDA